MKFPKWMNDPLSGTFVPALAIPRHSGILSGRNLETGDPMEVVAHPDFPVTIGGFTYHPQDRGDFAVVSG